MKMIGTPEGSVDRLFAECAAWRRVQNAVTGLFQRRGYSELMTPETEYYDLFVQAGYPLPQESMMKVIERSGRILAMRPDNTTPIARVTAAKLREQPLPQRLYYNQNVYRSDTAHTGASAEIAQCGVELIGAAGLRADLEIISMAVQTLQAAGVEDFQLELGCVDYFAALADQLDAPDETIAAVRASLEQRNYTLCRELLAAYQEVPAARAMARMDRLFGGAEILDEALALCPGSRTQAALDDLRTLSNALTQAGLGEKIRFDLGMVQRLDYYTGVVFRAFGRGSGAVLLSGGRYDHLIGRLGYDVPAIGFAVDVAAISHCLPAAQMLPPQEVVYYEDGYLAAALTYIAAAEQGSAVLSVSESVEAAMQEAKALGAKRLLILAEQERSAQL